MYITELLERQKNNNKIAMKFGIKSITFSKWYANSFQLSLFINKVIEKDSLNIALFLPNSLDYAIAYFSILLCSKTIVPIGIQSKGLEILSVLKYCEVDLIITTSFYKEILSNYLNTYENKLQIIYMDSFRLDVLHNDKEFILKSEEAILQHTEDNVAIMLHTSGTTSNPKRVMLTHRNLICNIESNISSLKLTNNDKALISMPMFFGYCNTAQFLTHLYLAASVIIFDSLFLPKLFFQTVQEEEITNFTGVPSMLLMLLDYKYAEKYNISSLRYICFGGSKMPVEQLIKLINRFPSIGFVQTYGQTEASPRITALLPQDGLRKVGSVGLPIPNVKVKIIDEYDKELGTNEIGEIAIQGQNIMKGYYKQKEITNNTIFNGWLHTGDLGFIDKDGYLYLVGRKKNMIISGGINIYPEEIEEILICHPKVKEAMVTSKEHPLLGEVPIAKIVVSEPCETKEIREFCLERLNNYKIPVEFIVVEALGKTITGKIFRGGNK